MLRLLYFTFNPLRCYNYSGDTAYKRHEVNKYIFTSGVKMPSYFNLQRTTHYIETSLFSIGTSSRCRSGRTNTSGGRDRKVGGARRKNIATTLSLQPITSALALLPRPPWLMFTTAGGTFRQLTQCTMKVVIPVFFQDNAEINTIRCLNGMQFGAVLSKEETYQRVSSTYRL